MNITDVDDKIIRDANAAGISIAELTGRHTGGSSTTWRPSASRSRT